MARSTALVLTAAGIAAADLITGDAYTGSKLVRIAVGAVGAALVSSGLDKVVPGFGTGAATLLVVAVLLDAGPRLSTRLVPDKK